MENPQTWRANRRYARALEHAIADALDDHEKEAVSEIMNMTRPPVRSEIEEIIHRVYTAGCAHG